MCVYVCTLVYSKLYIIRPEYKYIDNMSKTATHDSEHAAVIVWGFVPATATAVAATAATITDRYMLHSYIHVHLVVCLLYISVLNNASSHYHGRLKATERIKIST